MNLKTKDTSSRGGEIFYFNAKIKIQHFSGTNKEINRLKVKGEKKLESNFTSIIEN